MLQCNMTSAEQLKLGLEDVLGDLWDARRKENLGRLALVVHWDLRRWARVANKESLAERAQSLVLNCPQATREEYLRRVDEVIHEAERVHDAICVASPDIEVGCPGA